MHKVSLRNQAAAAGTAGRRLGLFTRTDSKSALRRTRCAQAPCAGQRVRAAMCRPEGVAGLLPSGRTGPTVPAVPALASVTDLAGPGSIPTAHAATGHPPDELWPGARSACPNPGTSTPPSAVGRRVIVRVVDGKELVLSPCTISSGMGGSGPLRRRAEAYRITCPC